MDAPAWTIDLLLRPSQSDGTDAISHPSSDEIDMKAVDTTTSNLKREAVLRWFSLLPFFLLVGIMLLERGCILRQKFFKFGLIAIISARFLCDLVPIITTTLLLYMPSDRCTAVTAVILYSRDVYEATLSSVTLTRLCVAYKLLPASVWWKVLILLMIPLSLSIPLYFVDGTPLSTPYCRGAFVGTIALKLRLAYFMILYTSNVIMGACTIYKVSRFRRKGEVLSEQYYFSIVIWLMSLIPLITFLISLIPIMIGSSRGDAPFTPLLALDLLRQMGLGIYSILIVICVPRIRAMSIVLLVYCNDYWCATPYDVGEIEMETRPFQWSGARTMKMAQRERMELRLSTSL